MDVLSGEWPPKVAGSASALGGIPGFAATACRLQLAGYAPAAGVVTDAVARVQA
jgi:hypothetical protein